MSSTDFNVGVSSSAKPSSRVLKPPGGGSSNIFGAPDVKEHQPRNIKNQQNSSSMNEVMGTTDPNILIAQKPDAPPSENPVTQKTQATAPSSGGDSAPQQRSRVPPGGYSQGLW